MMASGHALRWGAGSLALVLVLGSTASAPSASGGPAWAPLGSAPQTDLAPNGQLRVGLNLGNAVLASRAPGTGDLQGVTVDLGRELSASLGAEFVPIEYPNVGGLVDGARTNAWDVGFLAIDPARAAEMAFTAAYMEVDNTYLVPSGSPIQAVADADQPGVRIAVPARSAPDLFLAAALQYAVLVRGETGDAAFDLLRTGHADAFAGDRTSLLGRADRLPGSQVLPDRFLAVEHAVAVPKEETDRLAYVRLFVEWAKATGLVQQAIGRAGVRGVQVAPTATAP